MWIWREDTRPGGWRLEAASTWTWEAGLPHEWVNEPTPIFRAVASDWERRRREDVADRRTIVDTADECGHVPALPESRPGSGLVPVQRPRDAGYRREFAPADAPTPPLPRSGSEDEPRRRAEDRRPPLATTPSVGGRHSREPCEESTGRHALGFVTLTH